MEQLLRSAEPFFLPGHGENESTLIMAVHGFTGTPSEMRRVGYYLQGNGYTVDGLRLPGHGTSPEEMSRTNWNDWWQYVVDRYDEVKQQGYKRIVVLGHSMGGLLSLKLASEREVQGVISMAAPIFLATRLSVLAHPLQYMFKYIDRRPSGIPDIDAESLAYTRTPVNCVVSLRQLVRLVKDSLGAVHAPIFVGQGVRDGAVKPLSAEFIYRGVSSAHRKLKYYAQSSHGILLDKDRDEVYADILGFVQALPVKV
ncbi:alpha/beta hydrolase [Paenibacillus turpanensis]|uniref:alpha/beta hydrolase n=1 Tax=Paenibacillus turpanensis TaxID=2689078 RepID=UPI00140975B9|nr:alpha/beta fold hydrolase [Paenibacillus turpanensis]